MGNMHKSKQISGNSTDLQLRLVEERRNIDSGSYISVITFPMGDKTGSIVIDRGVLNDPMAIQRQILSKGGPRIPQIRMECVALISATPERRLAITSRGGWHGNYFVTRYGTINTNESDSDRIEFDTTNPEYRKREVSGNFEKYLEGLRGPLASSRYLAFIYAAALVPPLNDFIGRTGGFTIALSGRSSTGKTTSLLLAQSLVTKASAETDLQSWNRSANRAVHTLVPMGGLSISFKDLKSISMPRRTSLEMLRALVFSTADGSQRETMMTDQVLEPKFSIPMLSAEEPIGRMFFQEGMTFELGDAVRLLDIPVGAAEDGGVIDRLRKARRAESREIIAQVGRVISDNYGLVVPEWIKKIQSYSRQVLRERIERGERKFIRNLGPLESEAERIAKSFATVAYVGASAARNGYLPMDPSALEESVSDLFWRTIKGLDQNKIVVQEPTARVVQWLRNSKNFPMAKKGEPLCHPRAYEVGFRRHENGMVALNLRRDALLNHCTERFLDNVLMPKLLRIGVLMDKNTQTIKQSGLPRKCRFYKLNFDNILRLDVDSI